MGRQGKQVEKAIFDKHGQSAGLQYNIAGNAQFNPSSQEALAQLSKELNRVRRTRRDEIRAVENEFGNIRDLDRCFVLPDLQDFNPPDEQNSPGLIVSRQPAFNLFDEFLWRL